MDQKMVEVYTSVMNHVEAILCTAGADTAVVNRYCKLRVLIKVPIELA